jgi:RNA polymerase sigma-70 factor (ECF subfamily)
VSRLRRPLWLRFLATTYREENATDPNQAASHPVGTGVSAAEDLADVDRVLSGDSSAFEGLVRRWQRPLVGLAYRFCRDRSRAEDMAQEAFLRAYRSLSTWRRDAAFSTWLFAVATKVYCSEIRRIPPRPVPIEDVVEPADPRSTDYDDEDRDRLVRQAVQTLPARYRETLVLFYFHGMNVASAAQSLALPEGTVKARLSRGRSVLRRKLSQAMRNRAARGPNDQ